MTGKPFFAARILRMPLASVTLVTAQVEFVFNRIDYGINISSDNIKPRGFDQPEFRDTVKTLCQCFYVSGSEFFSYYSFPFDNIFFIITPPKKRHVAPYPNQIPAFPYQLVNSSTCSSDP